MSVRIDRVITRGGDGGQTSLGDGSRVSKACTHIDAIGAVDEANTTVGLLRAHLPVAADDTSAFLEAIQNLLFDVGADLCVPPGEQEGRGRTTGRLDAQPLAALEEETERLRAGQPPLKSFVLPGGTMAAAWAHLARTATRRAERSVVALSMETAVNPALVPLLNRLSDYFFVLARHLNDNGRTDTLWRPGATLKSTAGYR